MAQQEQQKYVVDTSTPANAPDNTGKGLAPLIAGKKGMDTGLARVAAFGGAAVLVLLALIGIFLTGFTATGSASQLRQGITFGGPATPTPRTFSAASAADLVRIQASSLGITPTLVTAASINGPEDTLVVGYDRALSDEEFFALNGIVSKLLRNNNTSFTAFAIAEAGSARQISSDTLQAWGGRRISADEFTNSFTSINLPDNVLGSIGLPEFYLA